MVKNAKQDLFDAEKHTAAQGPVECLGIKFPNDEARRNYFLGKLREKLKDPAFRKIEGFPIGKDGDILALSDPPYYTACPNPFIADFIKHYGKPSLPNSHYHREPFAFDINEGRHEPVYLAHTYHAKVPYRAVLKYILAYTDPGDIVYDGFAGTGMTGVACRSADMPPPDIGESIKMSLQGVKFGQRHAILADLSPIAGFLSGAYNANCEEQHFINEANDILDEVKKQLGQFYRTVSKDGSVCEVKYFVWSDVFICSECSSEISYAEHAYHPAAKEFVEEFDCPKCKARVSKRTLQRVYETVLDPLLRTPIKRVKQSLFITSYITPGGGRLHSRSVEFDIRLATNIYEKPAPAGIPCHEIPYMHMTHERNNLPVLGVTHIHHFFTYRNLLTIHALFNAALLRPQPVRRLLLFWLTSCLPKMSRLMSYNADGIGRVTKGIFYFSSVSQEMSPFHILERAISDIASCLRTLDSISGAVLVSTAGAQESGLPDNSIDYIFTDPPFGENIYYSDLNYLWESWIKIFTNRVSEAIVSRTDKKDIVVYAKLMRACFIDYYRILKPGRWITVEFHNSKNSIWRAIQEALSQAGFVVADVRTLDKKLGTFKQIVSPSTVKQDLIISAYKPHNTFEMGFAIVAGTEDGVWDFIRAHLRQLPVFVSKSGKAEVIAERQNYLLFDRMVAFHVQRGYSVPLSAADFYTGLRQKFPERDGMYFLSDQVTDYDRQRVSIREVEQLQLFVNDEKTAIQWVRQQLTDHPMTYQELSPLYMKEAQRVWEKHEQPLELRTILEQNFVEEDDGTWRVPDPRKESDLEQLRHRALMKEFQQYLDSKGKLKVVRTEALRAGFKESWQKQDYPTIVQMAKRVPETVIQEDSALLMYYDNALMRIGE
jgi:16S rRNA G966 N2-methylase RsmD